MKSSKTCRQENQKSKKKTEVSIILSVDSSLIKKINTVTKSPKKKLLSNPNYLPNWETNRSKMKWNYQIFFSNPLPCWGNLWDERNSNDFPVADSWNFPVIKCQSAKSGGKTHQVEKKSFVYRLSKHLIPWECELIKHSRTRLFFIIGIITISRNALFEERKKRSLNCHLSINCFIIIIFSHHTQSAQSIAV